MTSKPLEPSGPASPSLEIEGEVGHAAERAAGQRSRQRQVRELDPAQLAVKAGDAQGRDALRFAESSRDVEVDRGVAAQPGEGPGRAQEGALELDPRAACGSRP